MALTAVDKSLLQRCLKRESASWNDFVDRFVGLIYHTIHYTSHLRSHHLKAEGVEDIAQEVLKQISDNDYALLRAFRGRSSLATYLTVISRRICIAELTNRGGTPRKALPAEFSGKIPKTKSTPQTDSQDEIEEERPKQKAGMENLDLLNKLIRKLPSREREVVRLFYFEGRTYEEISIELSLPIPSIAPILKRARQLLRKYEDEKK